MTFEQRQRRVSGARDSMPAGDADKLVEQESFLGHEGKKRAGATSGSKLPARALNRNVPEQVKIRNLSGIIPRHLAAHMFRRPNLA